MISSWFVKDITLSRSDARARHVIQAIGSSSSEKGQAFVESNISKKKPPPTVQTYQEVYSNPAVDVVYIGTPHAMHKQNCLDAIAHGKHVLCEKPFAINAKEAKQVLEAARHKGTFVMEAMWTRFQPLVVELRKRLFQDKIIGSVRRTFCDFGLDMDLASLGPDSRLKNPALGAGSLLDVGIYSLTWGLLTLDGEHFGEEEARRPFKIAAVQTIRDGIDVASSVLLLGPQGEQGILSSTTEAKTDVCFCRIEGTDGFIEVHGVAASAPTSFTVYPKNVMSTKGMVERSSNGPVASAGQRVDFPKVGMGFYYEADAVALDIVAARLQNETMPHAETVRVMEMMDEIRRQGGARFPQDDE
jgi:predicted dehydrogenase